MTPDSHDTTSIADYSHLLQNYIQPVEDNGFSDRVLSQINKTQDQNVLPRRGLILAAAFTGGVIAARQLPSLSRMVTNDGLITAIPSLPALDISLYTLAGLSIFTVFALCSLLEPLTDV